MANPAKKPEAARPAPKPLSVYLGAAMAMLSPTATEGERMRHAEAVGRMLQGIQKYQDHGYRRRMKALEIVWREGTSMLGFCPAKAGTALNRAVLLTPSMINGSEILDLLPRRSFTRWLAEQGFDVYLLDWGVPKDDDGLSAVEGTLARLTAAAEFIIGRTGKRVDTIGYCMGGTLVLGAAANNPTVFGRLVLLSAPWDFHAGDARMRTQVMTGAASALQLLEEKKVLPVDWIQNVFAHVNPAMALQKFAGFLEMEAGSEDERMFVAVEDWLNGGRDLAGGVAKASIIDWYGHNRPGRGEWVDLGRLASHLVLVVAADKDVLVPPQSACAVVQHLPEASLIRPPCGHISLMAGRNAREMVWKPVKDWLLKPQ